MKKISALISFITIVLLSSCTNQPYALTNNASGQGSSKKMVKADASPATSEFMLVSSKPAVKSDNADANWVASSNPHVVAAASSRLSRMDAVALSAATTLEGHDILKREIEKAMKSRKASENKKVKPKKAKAPSPKASGITL